MDKFPRTWIAFCVSITALGAMAADPPGKLSRTATRDELRACMLREDDLGARQRALEAARAAAKSDADQLQAEASAIASQQAVVDRKDEKAVTSLNTRLEAHNAEVGRVNGESQAFNADKQAFDVEVLAYNQTCATNVYKDTDRAAVLKERQAPRQ